MYIPSDIDRVLVEAKIDEAEHRGSRKVAYRDDAPPRPRLRLLRRRFRQAVRMPNATAGLLNRTK